MPPELAYCTRSLATDDDHALAALRRLGLSAEIADDGRVDAAFWRASEIPVATVQAWWLHEAHPLHPDAAARELARTRILETLDLAVTLGAPRALAVCGFGDDVADRPFERCLDYFSALAAPARDRGLRVVLEPLSPRRCAVMWRVDEMLRLLDALAAPDVFGLCLDTGHLADSGADPGDVLAGLDRPIEELQLKGPGSAPPLDLPLRRWLGGLRAPPALLAFEHNVPLGEGGLDELVRAVRDAL